MRVALVVEYDGTRYHGFQYQTNASSVQEAVSYTHLTLPTKA